jgi:hypothetical protein
MSRRNAVTSKKPNKKKLNREVVSETGYGTGNAV